MKKFILCTFLLSLKVNAGLFGNDEINVPELRGQVEKLIDDQNVEKAEELFKSKLNNEYNWCFNYYPSGKCQSFKKEPPIKEFEELIKKAKQCEPFVKQCLMQGLDKETANLCIEGIESKCPISKNYDVGHPNKYAQITIDVKKKLADLRYSNKVTPDQLANAYNKCLDNTYWGYFQNDKPKESKIMFYPIKGKQYIVGDFKTESDCHEARIIAKDKNIAEVGTDCVKRYAGEDVVVKIYQSKAMYKYEENGQQKEEIITFISKEKCEESILSIRKYRFKDSDSENEEIEIGPFKSNDKNRFISKCVEKSEIVCKKNEIGFNKIDYVH